MDSRERLLAALSWDEPDQVPFTTYDWFLPRGERERAIRDLGLSTIIRLPAHKVEHRHVSIDSLEYWDHGERYIRRTIKTPVGDVSQLLHPDSAYGSTWVLEHFIKRPEDYKVLEYYFSDMVFHDNNEAIAKTDDELGNDGLVMVTATITKNDLQALVTSDNVDEITELGLSLNIMIGKIRDLLNSKIKEQENLKKAEMRALQAQINPHFLYNTLDTIIWMAESKKNDQVIEIVSALSKFFRISLSKGKDWITIAEEIEQTRSYLTIQKIRYRDVLDFNIDCDERVC